MEVKKGDKVLFYADSSRATGAGRIDIDAKLTFGIVKRIGPSGFVDILCQGESADYRAFKNSITKRLGNVFEDSGTPLTSPVRRRNKTNLPNYLKHNKTAHNQHHTPHGNASNTPQPP